MLVILEHLCKEIIWSTDGKAGLYQESQSFDNVITRIVVALKRQTTYKALTRRFLS
jgi:hypothetical protein